MTSANQSRAVVKRMPILVLTEKEIRDMLQPRDLISGLEAAFVEITSGRVSVPARVAASTPDGMLLAMPGYIEGTLAAKLVTVFPANHDAGLPSHHALIVAFDAKAGTPIALLDATYITAIRTAAATAVATKLLARQDASVLAILGAGVQAHSHLAIVPLVRNFTKILIASRTHSHAEAVARTHPKGIVVESFEEAVATADVVCCCTDASAPIVKGQWLRAGTHVNSVGFGKGPELDEDVLRIGRVFVESRGAYAPRPAGAHELQGLNPQDGTEVGEVLSGLRDGRRDSSEVTIYKSTGHAAEDVIAARLVINAARHAGLGQTIEL